MPIFEGLVTLLNNNLVHHDIKEPNILYNGEKMVLIDWGLSMNLDKISQPEDEFVGYVGYAYWPLDITRLELTTFVL